ncbi:MAG TPA: PAS domain-containing protein, partial [Roseivirga sp.]
MDSLKVGENLIFRKTLDVCPVSIFILDAQGEFIYANHKAEQIFGLTLSDLADRKYDSPAWHVTDFEGNLVAPEDFAFSRVMATGKPVEAVETAVNIANEARIYCSVNAYPLKNKSGEVEGVIATAEDLTALIEAKKRLERSDTNYKDLFMNLVYEVHLWKLVRDANGQINTWELIDANPPALKAWGKKHSEVIGKTAREIFSYDAEKQFMPLVQKIFEVGQPYAWEQYFEPTNQWLS